MRKFSRESKSDIGWLAFILAGWFLLLAPGTIEGTAHPVVTPLRITETQQIDEKWTQFSGRAVKLRQCSFRRVDWYLGTREKPNTPVDIVMSEPQIRLVGQIPVEDWKAKIAPPEALIEDTFSDVFHQCTLFGIDMPWLTKSRFWN